MNCPACDFANRDGARFCSQCGVALALVCGACGHGNDGGSKFCEECGASLTAPAPVEAEAPKPNTRVEIRQVTVLFADLTDYTRLTRALGAERTHRLVTRFFEIVDGLVGDFGGSVERHIGDEVMAVFGAPVAHSNDPERALRTAVAIHAAMPALGDEIGQPVSVHAGIASGSIVFSGISGEGENAATVGEAVNLAARLAGLSVAGETVVSEAVYRANPHIIMGEAMGEVALKGVDAPVKAWRVDGLADPSAGGDARPFVGREAERRQFAGIAAACVESGHGQTIYVRGEAGIGKSRLVDEFQAAAGDVGYACHSGLVLDFGAGRDEDAARTVTRSLLGLAATDDEQKRQAAADKCVSDGLAAPERRVHLNELLGVTQPADLRAMYDAMDGPARERGRRELIGELVSNASARQPVLIRIEDIHWADPGLLGDLFHLAEVVSECRALLVMTSRVEGDPLLQCRPGGVMATMDLGPLPAADALALAREYFDADDGLAATCVERAEGNPLFLDQLLRNAEESSERQVPGSIQSIVLARMDSLTAVDREALQAASVMGQRFSLEVLRHLVGNPDYDAAPLVAHYLVRPLGDEYLFSHALIRDGVYGSLLTDQRKALHLCAGAWFESRDAGLTAEHLDRAESPDAAAAYLIAAVAETGRYRYHPALRAVERGIEIATAPRDRFVLANARGRVLADLGQIEEAIQAFEAALELAQSDIDQCQAWIGMAAGMRVISRYDEALDRLDRAEAVAKSHNFVTELAQIHYHRGSIYFLTSRVDGCLEQHEMARDLARRADSPEDEARALSGLGDAVYSQGRMVTAYEYFARCVALSSRHGFGAIEAANMAPREMTRYYKNDLKLAGENILEAAEFARTVGNHRAEMVARSIGGTILVDLGEIDEARLQCEQSLEVGAQIGARQWFPFCHTQLGRILHLTGRRDEAAETINGALDLCRDVKAMGLWGPWLLGVLAVVTEDREEWENALAEGTRIIADGCVGHCTLWFHRDAMESALAWAEWDRAEAYATALEAFTSNEPLPWSDLLIRRARALACFGKGALDDDTLKELRNLVDEFDRVGLRADLPALEQALDVAAAQTKPG